MSRRTIVTRCPLWNRSRSFTFRPALYVLCQLPRRLLAISKVSIYTGSVHCALTNCKNLRVVEVHQAEASSVANLSARKALRICPWSELSRLRGSCAYRFVTTASTPDLVNSSSACLKYFLNLPSVMNFFHISQFSLFLLQ